MNIHFEIVLPCEQHAQRIMQWRNDLETRAVSFHSLPKTWPAFYQEFLSTYFTTPELPSLFAWEGAERVACLRFRTVSHPQIANRKCCEISLNVAPGKRGKGIGTHILQEIAPWVRTQGYDDILAEIKPENRASVKAFEKAGFSFFKTIDKELEETGKVIPVAQYLLPLTKEKRQNSVFIIAEAGSNWRVGTTEEDYTQACRLVDVAKEAGCDAVKFQTFRSETLYVPNAGESDYLAASGIREDIYHLLSQFSMPYELIPKIAAYCKKRNIFFMSTPFSPEDFHAVDPYVKFHKIGSYEISHPHLIRLAAKSGKPTFLSTGAATLEDISWAVNEYFSHQGENLTLLQCTAKYPAEPESLNLRTIPLLAKHFGVASGLSDHSRHPYYAPVAAVSLGASAIEKHFTLDRSLPGPDHAFSLLPDELALMVLAIRETEKMLGTGIKEIMPAERELFAFARRGVQAISNIRKGEVLQENVNFAILRPGKQSRGIHPKFIEEIKGKKAVRNIPLGQGIQREDWK